jgi:hypothetical protein
MMEKDEFLKDDFLRELIQRSPLDSPSDDFVDRVMANIQLSPEVVVVKTPFYQHLKAAVPYAIITLFVFLVIATSDLPIFNWFPGKEYLTNNLAPYLGTLLLIFKNAFASKFVSWGLLISFSAGMLFLIDRFFSRRTSV